MRKKNVPLRTAVRFGLVFAALGCFSLSGHAAYAQLAPPAGASTGTGGQLMYKPAANEKWLQSTVRTNAALNVGGRTVQVPAAMRMAANAPRYLARGLFAHPAVLAGTLAIPFILDWAADKGFFLDEHAGGVGKIWLKNEKFGESACDISPSVRAAWQAAVARGNVTYGDGTKRTEVAEVRQENGQCHLGGRWTTVFSTGWSGYQFAPIKIDWHERRVPATPEEFEEGLAQPGTGSQPLPDNVANQSPVPLPVAPPVINPSPAAQPLPQPLSIPLGDPVPVPNTDPQQYRQPVAHVTPSPTPSNPWRVDVREDESVSTSPEGLPDPTPNEGSPEIKPDEKPDFCESNPESLACAEMDTPEGEIPRSEREVTYQAEDVLGGGACPANKVMTIHGQQITVWDWEATCGNITTYVRPVVLAVAAFIALMILVPAVRGEL